MAVSGRATFTRGRRVAIGLNVLVASLLAPLIGGVLLYLAFKPELRTRVDLTERGSFTLSERTLKILEGLEEEVNVYTCFQPIPYNEAGMPAPGLEIVIQTIALHVNDLLREFEVRSRGKLRAHAYDPNFTGHHARIEELRRLIGQPLLNVAVVECGAKRRVLNLSELAAYDSGTQTTQAMTRPSLTGFRDEEALAKAILSVTEERQITLGFLRGHGERDPGAVGIDPSGRPAMGRWRTYLQAQNYAIASLDLSEVQSLAKDAVDVLVVADPVKPLTAAEVEVIVRYAKDGGKLAVMLGPNAANSLDFPLLTELFGLQRTPHPVCQLTTVMTSIGNLTSEANVFFVDEHMEHPITRPLRAARARTIWKDVCALLPTGREGQTEVAIEPLAWSGKDSWIDLPDAERQYNHEFDPGTEDKQRPYALAFAVTRRAAAGSQESGRAVVLGSASPLDDANIEGAPGNHDLGLAIVDWLAQREQLIAIAPRPFDVARVDLTEKEFGTIFLYVVVGVPALALLLGIAVFWLRRN